ncbi:DNA primase, partial [Candidatus Sumerlaeota bacterium]|nr:DNA primase [Candidatus Sumerlaeota bacterium]
MKTNLTEFAEKVRETANIVDIIGSSISLKRSGASYKGLCPFHKEKTPSFHVHPGKQLFHCFGCGVGGDVIKFIMLFDRLDYRNAIEQLAHRIGLPMPELVSQPKEEGLEKRRRAIFEVNQFALERYQRMLKSPEANAARDYLVKRGITGELIRRFGIGYAPDRWDDFLVAAGKKGFSASLLEEAGLVLPGKKGGNFYDRFRGRIIFPIFNLQGQCVGFGGRILDKGEPKYINSPESEVYKKGKLLYGLNLAREQLREDQPVLLVEGYMDLIALYKHGFQTGVATLGTALTDDQARLLKRFTKEVVFVYDGDEAGQKAMIRGCEVFLGQSLSVKVVTLPEMDDPDTFLAKHGKEQFSNILETKRDFLDFFLETGRKMYNLNTPEGKINMLDLLKPMLSRVHQPILFDDYIRRLSEALKIELKLILKHIKARTTTSLNQIRETIQKQVTSDIPLLEMILLKILVEFPDLRSLVHEYMNPDWLTSPQVKKYMEILLKEQTGEFPETGEYSRMLTEAPEEDGRFLRELAFCEFEQKVDPDFLSLLMRRIHMAYESQVRHNLVLEIRNKEINGQKQEHDITALTDIIHNKTKDIWKTRKNL